MYLTEDFQGEEQKAYQMFGSGGRRSWGIGRVSGEGQFQGDQQDVDQSCNMALN